MAKRTVILIVFIAVVLLFGLILMAASGDSEDTDTPDVIITIDGDLTAHDKVKNWSLSDDEVFIEADYTIVNVDLDTLDTRIGSGPIYWYLDWNGERYSPHRVSLDADQPSALLAGWQTSGSVYFKVPSSVVLADCTVSAYVGYGDFTLEVR